MEDNSLQGWQAMFQKATEASTSSALK